MHSKLDVYQKKVLQENFDDSKARSFKFFLSSGVLHLSLIASTLLINELVPKSEIKELVQIEFQTPTTVPTPAAPEVPLTPAESQVSMAPEIGPEQAATAIVKPAKIARAARTKAATKTAKISNQETTKVFAPKDQSKKESLAPIATEAKAFDANDLDEDFDKMDSEKSQQISNLKKELEDSTSDILVKHDEALKKLKQKTDLQNKALADHTAKMKAEDLAKIQGALAAEKASELAAELAERDARDAAIAAENAAKARAAEQAAQKAAAARAQAAAKAAAERAQAEKLAQELAFGNSLGVDVPVRSLQELKQFPGNPRPNFDNDDRLAQRQGEIAFLAYVEMDGRISKFKLLKSTGHRSLDAKTYAAIRQWRFFPGQDGWVEIPIKWDLKGGVQEMPTTLRRSISQK